MTETVYIHITRLSEGMTLHITEDLMLCPDIALMSMFSEYLKI